jgi:hypothetical protein
MVSFQTASAPAERNAFPLSHSSYWFVRIVQFLKSMLHGAVILWCVRGWPVCSKPIEYTADSQWDLGNFKAFLTCPCQGVTSVGAWLELKCKLSCFLGIEDSYYSKMFLSSQVFIFYCMYLWIATLDCRLYRVPAYRKAIFAVYRLPSRHCPTTGTNNWTFALFLQQ